MRVWITFRYLIARMTFFALRIPLKRFEKEVSRLWADASMDRLCHIDECLAQIRPIGSDGVEVCSLVELEQQSPLTKKELRERKFESQYGFSRHTAGTSGEPTNISLSKEELARMLAVRSYCYQKHGLRLGQREARIWGRAENTLGAKVRDFLLNRKVFYPAEKGAEKVVERLIDWRPEYLYGYSSLVLEAARIIVEKGMRPEGIKAVVCTAESILPSQKEYISNAFNAPVLEEYGSTEFDIIAFECKSGHLHLVNPWLWIETRKGEALISDVSRASQSLVRYRLGDSFVMSISECRSLGSQWVIKELHGRTINQFAYLSPTEKFHAVVFARAVDAYMSLFGDCFRFMVRQTNYCSFDFYLSETPSQGSEHFKAWLGSELRDKLALDSDIELEMSFFLGEGWMEKDKYTYFIQDLVFEKSF
ncbi:MAG: hypothetical protein HLUCCX14_02420 [Marinobacter excellens HL-55]|uniref:Coenzyme F390 synthetase n=1 Tax=Marinobacter excellens HL-55 TaxID=1305731 RepID=A0A0P8BAE3_9GAMM|nr:MAG: hypothetical protein HLUCCX14_02420 [Marinobacter excellens HL-55]